MRRIASKKPFALTLAALAAAVCSSAMAQAAPGYAVTARIPGADGGWDYASVDPDLGRLYVARANSVMMVDLATSKVTDALAPAQRSHEVLPIDHGAIVAQTDGTSGRLRFIDTATGAVTAQVATGTKPDFAYLDAATGLIVVMNPGSDTVALVDPKMHAVVRTIKVPGGLEAGGSDGHGHAFVNLEDASALAEIDLNAGTLLRTIPLTGCEGPTGLAMLAGGTRVMSACANGVATVVDAATGKLVQTLAVGKGPDAVIDDPARGLVFVPAGQAGTLTEIAVADPANFHVVATIPTQVGARTGALDPRTGKIYLPAATMMPAAPGEHHASAKPGSFVVLVVSPRS